MLKLTQKNIASRLECRECDHFWEIPKRAFYSYSGPKRFVRARSHIQNCPNCESTDLMIRGVVMDGQVYGIDISHWQGVFNFEKAQSRGYKFCYIKATEGTQYIDSQFRRSWEESPRHGLLPGAYHFFRPGEDALRQAEHFCDTVGSRRIGDLPPVLDLETMDHQRVSQVLRGVQVWLEYVKSFYGVTPILYSGPSFLQALGDLSQFKDYPLWIAHYGVSSPTIPRPWRKYTFWQMSEAGGLDLDVFGGSIAELRALAGIS